MRAAPCVWVLGALLLFAARGSTDAQFRITHRVKAREGTAIVLEGQVWNDVGRDVVDVWVTAEALNASGKVLSTGIVFVGSMIRKGDSATFKAKLPAAESAESFRLAVTSYRFATEVQSP